MHVTLCGENYHMVLLLYFKLFKMVSVNQLIITNDSCKNIEIYSS